jgi:hypothetical protein
MSEGDFRSQLALAAREQRDAAVADLKRKYAPKLATLEDQLRRGSERIERERSQLSQQRMQSAFSIGASVLGALLGRRSMSAANVNRAASAARAATRIGRESGDVDRANESLEVIQQRQRDLQQQFDTDAATLQTRFDASAVTLRKVQVSPRKSDIAVGEVALVWTPWRKGPDASELINPQPAELLVYPTRERLIAREVCESGGSHDDQRPHPDWTAVARGRDCSEPLRRGRCTFEHTFVGWHGSGGGRGLQFLHLSLQRLAFLLESRDLLGRLLIDDRRRGFLLSLQVAQLHDGGRIARQVVRADPAFASIREADAHEALAALDLVDGVAGFDRRHSRARLLRLRIDVEHEFVRHEQAPQRLVGHCFVLRRCRQRDSCQQRKCRYTETASPRQDFHSRMLSELLQMGNRPGLMARSARHAAQKI